MPDYRIYLRSISILLVSFFGAGLGAEETGSFVTQPVVSFVTEGVAAPPRQGSQLHGFRDALTSRPVATAELKTESGENPSIVPPIRQAAMSEPLPLIAERRTPVTPIEETREIPVETKEPAEVPVEPTFERPAEKRDDSVLDKPIGFAAKDGGKTGETGKMERPQFAAAIAPLISIIGSLLIVLSAFFILMMIFKKMSPKSTRQLPKEAFENLGRTFLTPKLQLHLLRLGNRLILVSVTQDGVSPITEVTDPDEVVPLLGLCRQLDPNSSTELFRKMYAELTDDEPRPVAPPKKTASKPKGKSPSLVDLYSEPDESLAEILASGIAGKGGRYG